MVEMDYVSLGCCLEKGLVMLGMVRLGWVR
jgi:hypothetical protein